MAKKRTNAKKKRRAKSFKQRTHQNQFIQVILSIVLLALVVILGAVVARWLIPPATAPARVSGPQVGKSDSPTFEVFSKLPATPHKPQTKLPPITGLRPPLVAIIIDDVGYNRHLAEEFLDLDAPLTFSMLPYGPFNHKILDQARARGLEIMLHLPMEPFEYPEINPGPGALLSTMTPDEFIFQLIEDIDRLPGIVGVNNHMGSRVSTSPERMRQIFSVLKSRNLFYIDSRTTAETIAKSSAQLLQLPFAERDIFIDHLDDPVFIHSQLEGLIQRAKTQGYAIGIAHPHPATVNQLKAFMPRLKTEVTLVPASALVKSVMLAESRKVKAASISEEAKLKKIPRN